MGDPYYRGETAWHNPLLPAVGALVAEATGLSVHAAYTRAGAYLNILAPVAFYAWVLRLAGPAGATVATLGFVFWRETWGPGWVTAAYSPWLFAMTASQPLLYAALVAYHSALGRATPGWHALAGALTGLAFLAAAPPALVLAGAVLAGSVFAVLRARRTRAPGAVRRVLLAHAVLAAATVLVSAPFLYSILWRYRLHVVNRAPTEWQWAGFDTLLALRPDAPAAFALAGLVALGVRARRGRAADAVLVFAWVATCVLLLAYRPLFAALGVAVPQFVPAHYFVFYLQAAKWILAGIAAAAVVAAIPVPRWAKRRPSLLPAAAAALVLAVVLASLPQYRTHGYFASARETAQREGARRNLTEAYAWIRAHTDPGDVFLASPDMSWRLVGPAGRKAVVVGRLFSSPYIDYEARARAAEQMWRAILDRDAPGLRRRAEPFGVTYVLSSRQDQEWLDRFTDDRAAGLDPVFRSGGLQIRRVTRH